MINDISFAFKVKLNNKSVLETNFKRELIFNEIINKYEISNKLLKIKTKKLKFFKQIKYKKII